MDVRVVSIGGGPAGLFAAALIKADDATHDVVVLERNRPEDVFGFGVVFSDATLGYLEAADPVLHAAMEAEAVHWTDIEVRIRGRRLRCGGNGFSAISRRRLLALLRERAAAVGVELRHEVDVPDVTAYDDDADLVLGADGANSRVRARFTHDFRPDVHTATAKYIWFGTTQSFDALTFLHERSEHGWFAVHAYPFDGRTSTFIVECDEPAWRAAGLDDFDVTQPRGLSDEASMRYVADLFAPHLDGHGLLGNNSRWGNFRTWRAQSWVSGKHVLLGDAAHTAHFSVGSGTKMAMEDAIALATAVRSHPADVPAALSAYQSARQPQVGRIQRAARPSLAWWEHFGFYAGTLEPEQFGFHFLTRSRKVTHERLAQRDAAFVADADRWFTGSTGVLSVLSRALGPHPHRVVAIEDLGGLDGAVRMAAPDHESRVAQAYDAAALAVRVGAALLVIDPGLPSGERTAASDLAQVQLCEQIRLRLEVPVVLVDPDADADLAATYVLSGRADLVAAPASVVAGWGLPAAVLTP